ncbi:hypothetical protein GCM10010412_028630 [Nonomuraea recticatena]|uniref:Uncharacterized protein n=1 Tax=Nonomuraea recticatena TaxID=46178 RepID=A0ABN3RPW1_9ACTN
MGDGRAVRGAVRHVGLLFDGRGERQRPGQTAHEPVEWAGPGCGAAGRGVGSFQRVTLRAVRCSSTVSAIFTVRLDVEQ